jgi:hypothetical protein
MTKIDNILVGLTAVPHRIDPIEESVAIVPLRQRRITCLPLTPGLNNTGIDNQSTLGVLGTNANRNTLLWSEQDSHQNREIESVRHRQRRWWRPLAI